MISAFAFADDGLLPQIVNVTSVDQRNGSYTALDTTEFVFTTEQNIQCYDEYNNLQTYNKYYVLFRNSSTDKQGIDFVNGNNREAIDYFMAINSSSFMIDNTSTHTLLSNGACRGSVMQAYKDVSDVPTVPDVSPRTAFAVTEVRHEDPYRLLIRTREPITCSDGESADFLVLDPDKYDSNNPQLMLRKVNAQNSFFAAMTSEIVSVDLGTLNTDYSRRACNISSALKVFNTDSSLPPEEETGNPPTEIRYLPIVIPIEEVTQ